MKRFGLALALLVSIVLIGGAAWHRLSNQGRGSGTLSVVNSTQAATDPQTVDDFLAANATDTSYLYATSSEKLSTTDLFSRQLFSDYFSLAQNGQATDQNLSALADNYANNAVRLGTYAAATAAGLQTVANSKTNYSTYGQAVTAIYASSKGAARTVISGAGDLSELDSPAFAAAMSSLGDIYKKAALELEAVPVPSSLADTHLKLVNNYLSNTSALADLANINKDAVTAYAALNTQAVNSTEEASLLGQIQAALMAQGVNFNIGS